MKAVVKATQDAGSLQVVDFPVPTIGPEDVLVRVKAAGICYSDVSILTNRYIGRKPVPIPLIMGHEGAGVVEEVGSEVQGIEPGMRVAFEALWGCGKCKWCKVGYKNMCKDWEHLGITRHGTFAEYVVVPAKLVHPLSPGVDFLDAALLEPLGLTVRTLEFAKPLPGETVAIIGPGALGMLHLQAFLAAGASKIMVIGLDQDKKRFEIAESLGAHRNINISREDPVKALLEETAGYGADIVVETANSPEATRLAVELAAPRGRVILFGLYPEATISPVTLLRNGLTVHGDVAILPHHFLMAMNWVESGKVNVKPMISRTFPLEDAQSAFEALRYGETVKVVFEIE
ncbi:zinc-dependent alcohol dehydrogenase [Thermodesulforhabdus norvegica]|uniref:L-iditol 2-dehydrogenase n=1 Tax=Thermodesulforhabdus norvegica TaxID=39841 RepID=A0A1I4VXC9_9BACT|nr:alcohol dehydrogenase catalytic domain-containing protein [Thermodesulforhabdus norvegica]SFN05810.1 L-iditol 2-dehydrogenase [Thermodesulforhabdus norvegica]